jgi:hypothetical protein
MADPKDQIAALVQAAEEAAYKRGFKDACDRMKLAVNAVVDTVTFNEGLRAEVLIEPADEPAVRKTGRPPSVTIGVVQACINASPGKKGVEVVKAAQMIDPTIQERTVRTALRRLRINKKIWQRKGLWYPKPVHIENDDEESKTSAHH